MRLFSAFFLLILILIVGLGIILSDLITVFRILSVLVVFKVFFSGCFILFFGFLGCFFVTSKKKHHPITIALYRTLSLTSSW